MVGVMLHAGVSSPRSQEVEDRVFHAEPFDAPWHTAERVAAAGEEGRPVAAAGTTAVRALESARDNERVRLYASLHSSAKAAAKREWPGHRFARSTGSRLTALYVLAREEL